MWQAVYKNVFKCGIVDLEILRTMKYLKGNGSNKTYHCSSEVSWVRLRSYWDTNLLRYQRKVEQGWINVCCRKRSNGHFRFNLSVHEHLRSGCWEFVEKTGPKPILQGRRLNWGLHSCIKRRNISKLKRYPANQTFDYRFFGTKWKLISFLT